MNDNYQTKLFLDPFLIKLFSCSILFEDYANAFSIVRLISIIHTVTNDGANKRPRAREREKICAEGSFPFDKLTNENSANEM